MTGQMSHASNPRARKKAREGERRMHAEWQQSGQPPMAPEQARARLEEIARHHPATSTPDAVDVLARVLAVHAQAAVSRVLASMAPDGPPLTRAMVTEAAAGFAGLHLLAALRAVPHIAGRAAREILGGWDDGQAAAVLVAKHCRALGIDPDEVTRLEEVLAGGNGNSKEGTDR